MDAARGDSIAHTPNTLVIENDFNILVLQSITKDDTSDTTYKERSTQLNPRAVQTYRI